MNKNTPPHIFRFRPPSQETAPDGSARQPMPAKFTASLDASGTLDPHTANTPAPVRSTPIPVRRLDDQTGIDAERNGEGGFGETGLEQEHLNPKEGQSQ